VETPSAVIHINTDGSSNVVRPATWSRGIHAQSVKVKFKAVDFMSATTLPPSSVSLAFHSFFLPLTRSKSQLSSTTQSGQATTSPAESNKLTAGQEAGIGVGVGVAAIIVLFLGVYIARGRWKLRRQPPPNTNEQESLTSAHNGPDPKFEIDGRSAGAQRGASELPIQDIVELEETSRPLESQSPVELPSSRI
jgi:hypothetical protein